MFSKILVALDISQQSEKVFAQSLALAKQHQANLMLLHVLSPEEENSPLPIPPDLSDMYPSLGNELTIETWRKQWQAFEQQGLDMLRRHSEEANTIEVNNQFEQKSGSPGKTICQTAKDWQADLIVVGRRGRSGLTEFFLGSISNYVLHHAPCSILIVQ